MVIKLNITKNLTTLTLLGLTLSPILVNSNNSLKNNLNSHYVLSQIAHANTPATDIDSLTETAHTPVYHLETAQGWSNDLQTINWNEKGGYYDIYFLHSVDGATNPFGPNGQNWTHCTTKDFVHFSTQNDAIPSNVKNSTSSNDQSWKSAWTGSVVQNQGNIAGVPKGDYVAYFSGLKKADGSQNIWAVWSDDNGRTFSHVLNNGNPVLPYNASFASNDKDNERDAYVCYWNGKMLMYCAEGDKLGVYQSKDGINWSKADPAGASKVLASTFMKGVNWTDANKPVECPCLKMMTTPDGQTKAVLFYGDKTPQDGQTTGTYYVVGHLDQNGLFAAETNAKRLDLGSDYYGSNFSGTDDLNKPNTSIDTIGWVGNWSYTSQGVHNSQDGTGPYTGRLGSYTLPRKLTLNNDLTLSSNIDDSNLHLTKTNDFNNVTKDKPATKDGKLNILGQDADYGPIYTLADIPNLPANGEYDLHFTNTDGYKGRIYIDIWQGADYVKLNFDPTNNNFRVAGKATELNDDLSGTTASSAYYDGMLGNGNGYAEHLDSNATYPKDFHLKVFTDKDSVEFQFPNGQTYTIARYAINDSQDFKVYTQDPTGKNTLSLAVNTVDTLSKPATGNSSSSESAPSSSSATPKPNDSKPSTGTTTSTKPVEKPSTDTKPTPAVSSAKPSDTNTTYKYSVAYFNNATGQSIKTIDFNSSSQLLDNDLRNKISASAPGKVVKYNIDQTKKNNDGSTTVDVIVLVDTNSVNTTTSSLSNQAPSSSSSQSANKPTASSSTSSSKSTDTKPVTSNSKTNSKPVQSGDKPVASSTKPDDHKASSSNSDKNDNQKPAAGNSYDSNKVTSSSTKDDNKSSSSNKTSNNKPTVTNSDKSNNNADNKPATSVSESKLDNKLTSSTKADHDKTNLHSDKSDNSHKGEPTHKTDTESAQHGGSSTKTDSNKATDKKSAISSMSESSKKNSDNSEINSVKSNSSSSNKHNGEADTESVKSLSSSNSSSKKNLSVKNEVSSESSLTNSAKSGKTNENSKNKTVNGSSVKAEAKDGADNESDANVSSSSATETATPANGNQSNNVFQEQTAGGTNDNSEPHQGAVSNSDDTYSEQKAAMLAKTNAKAEQGEIVAVIGTVIGMIAGWFGLKKKNE